MTQKKRRSRRRHAIANRDGIDRLAKDRSTRNTMDSNPEEPLDYETVVRRIERRSRLIPYSALATVIAILFIPLMIIWQPVKWQVAAIVFAVFAVVETVLSVRLTRPGAVVFASLASRLVKSTTVSPATEALAVAVLQTIVRTKQRQRVVATIALMLGVAAHLVLALYASYPVRLWVLLMFAGGAAALNVNLTAFNFRVSHGLYGTTECEAREIIAFVLDHADTVDFTRGLGAADIDLAPEASSELAGMWGEAWA